MISDSRSHSLTSLLERLVTLTIFAMNVVVQNLSYDDYIQQSLVSGAGEDDHKWNHRGLQAITDYGITNTGGISTDHTLDTPYCFYGLETV